MDKLTSHAVGDHRKYPSRFIDEQLRNLYGPFEFEFGCNAKSAGMALMASGKDICVVPRQRESEVLGHV